MLWRNAVRNIISGIVVIGIGIANGGSVFTGNPSGIDYLFDLIGLGLIGFGIFQTVSSRNA